MNLLCVPLYLTLKSLAKVGWKLDVGFSNYSSSSQATRNGNIVIELMGFRLNIHTLGSIGILDDGRTVLA